MVQKKPLSKSKAGRDSDQFLLRMPEGMRDMIGRLAASQNRSMNEIIVSALATYIAMWPKKPDDIETVADLEISLHQISKSISAIAAAAKRAKKSK